MVQMIQFLHMQGDPFHLLSNVLNSEIFSIVLIPLLIEFHNCSFIIFFHLICLGSGKHMGARCTAELY